MLQRYVGVLPEAEVGSVGIEYVRQFEAAPASRAPGATALARRYYEVVTQFYERGWGDNFHFVPRGAGESLPDALRRYERHLGERLGLAPGAGSRAGMRHRRTDATSGHGLRGPRDGRHHRAVPVGARSRSQRQRRAGGPLRLRGGQLQQPGVPELLVRGDVHHRGLLSCGRPARSLQRRISRVRLGGRFASYDWCLLDPFNPAAPDHLRIRRGIEKGNGVAALHPTLALCGKNVSPSHRRLFNHRGRSQAGPINEACEVPSMRARGHASLGAALFQPKRVAAALGRDEGSPRPTS
jgi:sterol 24-C-methyltransferase